MVRERAALRDILEAQLVQGGIEGLHRQGPGPLGPHRFQFDLAEAAAPSQKPRRPAIIRPRIKRRR